MLAISGDSIQKRTFEPILKSTIRLLSSYCGKLPPYRVRSRRLDLKLTIQPYEPTARASLQRQSTCSPGRCSPS